MPSQPIIGILCMDPLSEMCRNVESHIGVHYVRMLEDAKALVVPIRINKARTYYEQIMCQVNGVLFQGGQVFVNKCDTQRAELTNHCVRSAQIIIEIAQRKYDEGNAVPIFGICLGFQLLVLFATATKTNNVATPATMMAHVPYGTDPREECNFMGDYLPVKFTSDIRQSRLFAQLSETLMNAMQTLPLFCHSHRYCFSVERLRNTLWHILGTNIDANEDGTPCKAIVTLLEHRIYPFYGSQSHPERVYEHCALDEKANNETYLRSQRNSCTEYFADFFINECRKNKNCFEDCVQLKAHSIHNYDDSVIEWKNRQYYIFTY